MGKELFEDATRGNVFYLDPENIEIVEDKDDPLYDERIHMKLDEGLVRNVMMYGVIEPVVVRKNGTYAQVIDGRQRVRAAVEANKRLSREGKETIRVPVVARKGTAADLFGVMISTNENRIDDMLLTKAAKAARFLSMGKTEQEAAIAFGVEASTVRLWTSLLDLHEDILAAVRNGKIAPTSAAELAKLPRDEQKKAFEELVARGDTTIEASQTLARATKARSNGKPKPTSDEEPARRAPPRTVLRKVVEMATEAELDDGFVRGVRWAIGDLEARSVKGLSGILNELGDKFGRRQRKGA